MGCLVALTIGLSGAGATVPLFAQAPVDPEATAILEVLLEARAERVEGVASYTLVQAVNGIESTLYFERVEANGHAGFRVVPPHEYQRARLERAGFYPPLAGGADRGSDSGAPGVPDDLGPAGEPEGRTRHPRAAGGPLATPTEMPDLASLSESLPSLPGSLSDLAGGVPGDFPGAGGARGGGSVLQRALGAAAEGAAGGLQQRLARKGVESLLATEGADDAADVRLHAEMIRTLVPHARVSGTEEVDGRLCRVLAVDDLGGVELGSASEDFFPRAMSLCVDEVDRVVRRSVIEGEARFDGERHPLRIEVLEGDHREVEGMVEPFRRVIRISGMTDAMDAPAIEVAMEIRALRVNEPPPDMLGTADLRIEGPLPLELSGMLPRVSPLAGAADGETVWQIELVGRTDEGRTVLLQLFHTGDLPASGRAPATARGVVSTGPDGTEAGFATQEDEATVTVRSLTEPGAPGVGGATMPVSRMPSVSGTPGHLEADFEFEAVAEIRSDEGTERSAVRVRGSLEAPVVAPLPDAPSLPAGR